MPSGKWLVDPILFLYHLELWLVIAGGRESGRRRKGGRNIEGGRKKERKKRRKGGMEVWHVTTNAIAPSLISQVTQQCT